jgi:surface antigen
MVKHQAGHSGRWRRALTALAVTGICAVMVMTATPAHADTTLCSGNSYSSCTNNGYTEHGYAAASGTSYWGMYAGHNCTNYVAYMQQVVNGAATVTGLGNARYWATNAAAKGYLVNGTPMWGAVAQWNSSAGGATVDGHVAYVESVNADGSITLSDDTYSMGPFRWRVLSPGSSSWPSNFIHFRDRDGVYQSFAGDYNGDGVADIALRNRANGWFYVRFGPAFTSQTAFQWDNSVYNFQAFVGDYNGDNQVDVGLRNPSNGWFYIRYGPGFTTQTAFQWDSSLPGYQAFVGDYNGDNVADVGLRNPSNGWFYLRYGPGFTTQTAYQWDNSVAGYQSFAGDFNGDNVADVGLRNPSSGMFDVRYGPTLAGQTAFQWDNSVANFQSFVADFNGDNVVDVGLRNPASGWFYLRYGPGFTTQTAYQWDHD